MTIYVDDHEDELDEFFNAEIEAILDRQRTSNVVSLSYYRECQKELGWKPLSLKDYAFKLRATQMQIVLKGLEDSRKIINERVKRQNKLTDKKKDKE